MGRHNKTKKIGTVWRQI